MWDKVENPTIQWLLSKVIINYLQSIKFYCISQLQHTFFCHFSTTSKRKENSYPNDLYLRCDTCNICIPCCMTYNGSWHLIYIDITFKGKGEYEMRSNDKPSFIVDTNAKSIIVRHKELKNLHYIRAKVSLYRNLSS